jgi:hypothetical protein
MSNDATAKTCADCAHQRAENLAILGAKSVLELCVGPSLIMLEKAYAVHGIKVTGNDIDPRWQKFHPRGNWLIGDALQLQFDPFDAVVFAPPLSAGCTGKREDALMINEVFPKYTSFLNSLNGFKGLAVMVLPGRSLSTSRDRSQFYELMSKLGSDYEVVSLTAGKRNITKYHDVYVSLR